MWAQRTRSEGNEKPNSFTSETGVRWAQGNLTGGTFSPRTAKDTHLITKYVAT